MATQQAARPAAPPRRRAARPHTVSPPARAPESDRSLSGEQVPVRLSTVEWVLYGAFLLAGAVMRLWDLGSRPLHHDESLHATYSWYLWRFLTGTPTGTAAEYHYDPMMHGPYQFHGNALMYLIFGVGATAIRLNAAFCGSALILVPLLLRRQLGRAAALILSGLLAFSPAFLYYSRFSREDIYFALWTALFFAGLIRWLDARGRAGGQRWLYLAAAGLALSWATKESAYFTIAIALGFVALVVASGYLYQTLVPRRPRAARDGPPSGVIVDALAGFARANLRPLVDALRGTPPRAWALSLGIMAVITLVLFWPLGDPWQWGFVPGGHIQPTQDAQNHTVDYNTDFLTGGLSYWRLQQAVQRGTQPWYYYFLVIPLYEQVAVVFGAAGLVHYFLGTRARPTVLSGLAFVLCAALSVFVGPSLPAPLHYALLLLMAVSGVALLVSQPRSLLVNLLLWWTVVTWMLYTYAGEKMPWLTLHLLLPTDVVAALYAGHVLRAARWSRRWIIAVALLAVTGLLSLRSSVALAYADSAYPTEMLIYTQTTPDVPMVSVFLHRLPLVAPAGGAAGAPRVRAWVDGAASWPLLWYLRDDPSPHGFTGSDTNAAAASSGVLDAAGQRYPAIVVGREDHDYLLANDKLPALAGYTPYEFRFRWWFPEDYKAWNTSGLGGFLAQAAQPASWLHLADWWATRAPFNPAAFRAWDNVYRFYVYVRADLARGYVPAAWDGARQRALADSVAVARPDDVPAALSVPVRPSRVIDGAALARPLAVARALAVGPRGDLYVTDSIAQRVVVFDRAGHYLTSWGTAGAGPGQFSALHAADPLGVAVAPDGHVYVADTWNGRLQEFTAGGAFVRAFGHPNASPDPLAPPTAGSLFGPRQLAVAPNGNVYVADTGNERIQVYSPTGRHLFNIGDVAGVAHGPSATLGHFYEPSGVAIDGRGVVYVADYWNRRIQRFTLDGRPLGAYPVAGWSTSDYNEPYLAVDGHGHLFATDAPVAGAPHVNHVLELDAVSGRIIRAFGSVSGDGALTAPDGVAVGPDSTLIVADGDTIKVSRLLP